MTVTRAHLEVRGRTHDELCIAADAALEAFTEGRRPYRYSITAEAEDIETVGGGEPAVVHWVGHVRAVFGEGGR